MEEDEFWKSTAAKVWALKDARREQSETRDFFTALTAANVMNTMATKDSKVWSAQDFLDMKYPKKNVIITHDPDRGALWVGGRPE